MPVQQDVPCILSSTQEDKELVIKTLGLTEDGIQEDVEAILDWFVKQPHLVDGGINKKPFLSNNNSKIESEQIGNRFSRSLQQNILINVQDVSVVLQLASLLASKEFIERMLLVCKGSREKTKKRIDNYYKYRSFLPEIIENRDEILINHSRPLYSSFIQILMPRLYKGNRITVTKFVDPNPSNMFTEDIFRSALTLSDFRLHSDYMLGDIWIIDLKSITLGHVIRLNPVIFQKAVNVFQEGMGMKVNQINVINGTSILEPILKFVKQFLKPKIMERIKLNNSIEDLHKYIPKEYLPKDYGGTLASIEELKDIFLHNLEREETKQFLRKNSKQISNEKLRPGFKPDEDCLAGSFRKLDFD